jgi:hypothetical protein
MMIQVLILGLLWKLAVDALILKEVLQNVGYQFAVYIISFKFSFEDNFVQ